jgi:IS1 family transposase
MPIANTLLMDYKKFHEKFLNFESDNDLFDKKINNMFFWERVRQKVSRLIQQELDDGFITTSNRNTHSLKNQQKLVKNLVSKNPFFASDSKVLFWGHERRKLRSDGQWWDLFCDPVIEKMEWDYVYLEKPYRDQHRQPAKTNNIRYLDLLYYSGDIRDIIGKIKFDMDVEEQKLLDTIQTNLNDRFDSNVNLKKITKNKLIRRESLYPLYKMIIRQINPNVVILAKHINRETFVECCKDADIPVIEIQHSMLHDYHYQYSFPNSERTKHAFPDYFFTYGDYWREYIDFPIDKNDVISVGYPYFNLERKKYIDEKISNEIVFISQPTAGRHISKFASKFDSISNYETIYKLHPQEYAQWQTVYPWLDDSEINVIDSDETPLYQLLSKSKIQVGVSSTAIFEGLGFDLDTYLIEHPRTTIMDHLIENNIAQLVSDPEELIRQIESPDNQRFDLEYIFKKNSIDNMVSNINKIMERHNEDS